jgi:glycosyltransferase involved in cell wall biosynthesis
LKNGLAREIHNISIEQGLQAAYNRLLRDEAVLKLRKPSLAIYDHAFHFLGGAQKYGLTLIAALQDKFDITILASKDVERGNFLDWYGLDLSACQIKVLKLPYFEEKKAFHLDPALIPATVENPFHIISRESGRYDFFVNNSMNEMVYPLANISVLVCHFPERRPKAYFYADRYSRLICNSRYTAEWIEKKWKVSPHQHIYPPVDMEQEKAGLAKKKYILSVARFEPEGTKRQLEMAESFLRLNQKWPEVAQDWTFILAGGSSPDNPYLARLEKIISGHPGQNIELKVNLNVEDLKRLYREATLFWHLCGLNHEDPAEIEHFGMTAVEAMQNGAVPIVYDGGGLPEIVDDGVNGFRVRSKAELLKYSMLLFRDQNVVQELSAAAQKKAQAFTRDVFEARVRTFFDDLLRTYISGGEIPPSK